MTKSQMWVSVGCISISTLCLVFDTFAARHNRKTFRRMEQDYQAYRRQSQEWSP